MLTKNEKRILIAMSVLLIVLLTIAMSVAIDRNIIRFVRPAATNAIDHSMFNSDDHKCIEQIDSLPDVVLQSYIANGWTFQVDKARLLNASGSTGIFWSGMIDYENKSIYVDSSISVVHEFGHYLDWALGFPEKHEHLYQSEYDAASHFLGSYAKTNSREYFASYFAHWVKNIENEDEIALMRTLTPLTYDYFVLLSENGWGISNGKIVYYTK